MHQNAIPHDKSRCCATSTVRPRGSVASQEGGPSRPASPQGWAAAVGVQGWNVLCCMLKLSEATGCSLGFNCCLPRSVEEAVRSRVLNKKLCKDDS